MIAIKMRLRLVTSLVIAASLLSTSSRAIVLSNSALHACTKDGSQVLMAYLRLVKRMWSYFSQITLSGHTDNQVQRPASLGAGRGKCAVLGDRNSGIHPEMHWEVSRTSIIWLFHPAISRTPSSMTDDLSNTTL